MKKFTIFIATLFFLASCAQPENKTQKVTVDGKFTIEVPDVMTKTKGLNDDACIEYQNTSKEYYLIVIDDNIEELNAIFEESDLDQFYEEGFVGYADFVFESLIESIIINDKPEWKEFNINKLPARQKEGYGKFDNIDIFYTYTLVHGKDYYYQIFMWTLKDNMEEFKKITDKVISSFKEI